MSELYNAAVKAAGESEAITWEDAADVIDPFLAFVKENMWNYGFGEAEPIIDVLTDDEV